MTMPIMPPGNYTIRLRVEDAGGLSDSTSRPITVRQDVVARFECSLDNKNWLACDNPDLKPVKGETVYFRDNSSPSENGTVNSWTWKKNGLIFHSNSANASTTFTEVSTTIITLTVRDNRGRTDSQSYNIAVRVPLPEWREIVPFSWLRKPLASVVRFINDF